VQWRKWRRRCKRPDGRFNSLLPREQEPHGPFADLLDSIPSPEAVPHKIGSLLAADVAGGKLYFTLPPDTAKKVFLKNTSPTGTGKQLSIQHVLVFEIGNLVGGIAEHIVHHPVGILS